MSARRVYVKPGQKYIVVKPLQFHGFKVAPGTVLHAPNNIPSWVQIFLAYDTVPVVYEGRVRLASAESVKAV